MNDNEVLSNLKKIKTLIAEAREPQDRCNHKHHCHYGADKLRDAEMIAHDLYREIEIQQGERLLQSVNL